MKRIITLGIVVLTISSLALAENSAPLEAPKVYSLKVSQFKFIVVSPFDSHRSVLIGIQKKDRPKPESYLAEGIMALAISRLAKMAAQPDNGKEVNKYAKQMLQARAMTMKVDSN